MNRLRPEFSNTPTTGGRVKQVFMEIVAWVFAILFFTVCIFLAFGAAALLRGIFSSH